MRVAIIGSGCAGLSAAWHLKTCNESSEISELVVYEKEGEAGGHANTIDIRLQEENKSVSVDTGFQVYNHQNYPNLVGLFQELGVEEENTCMSFGVSLNHGGIEWSSDCLFAQKRNAFRPGFHVMIRDILRFAKEAPTFLALDDDDPRKAVTVAEYLAVHQYSLSFTRYYLIPMAAALWSSSRAEVLNFSALTMLSFFHNHGMLQIFNRPQWKTPTNRCRTYVNKIADILGDSLELNNGVKSITHDSDDDTYTILDTNGSARVYDEVIFACHPDQSLKILCSTATEEERNILKAFEFASNKIYVHSDPNLMPRRTKAWSAWNYMGSVGTPQDDHKPVYVTYWLNKLQNLDCETQLFLSLNPTTDPDPSLTHRYMEWRHPQFSPKSERAQRMLPGINGTRGLHFVGAWTGYGFHEDGVRSGLAAACHINNTPVKWHTLASTDDIIGVDSTVRRSLVTPKTMVPLSDTYDAGNVISRLFRSLITTIAFKSIKIFLSRHIKIGSLSIVCPDKTVLRFGDGNGREVTIRVFDWWFFVRVALEYDLGLARSFLKGEWSILNDTIYYDGLREMFLLFIDNRDSTKAKMSASSLVTSWIGYTINFFRYRLSMDNSLSGSRSNISAHYDLSNTLFSTILDKKLLMYSSGIYDTHMQDVSASILTREMATTSTGNMPTSVCISDGREMVFKGSLEDAQIRKVDYLISKLKLKPSHMLLDIGFGWGGIAIRAAQTIGCKVTGITLSIEQKTLAEQKVIEAGVRHLVTFELVDYRVFAKKNVSMFDRIVSCEMIEAVGHNYLPQYFKAIEMLLKPDGIFVMEAITTPESRYPEYLKSTDFINTIIFPGSCCPSLTALLDAMATYSHLSLETLDNIAMHYSQTLREWRYRLINNLDQIRGGGVGMGFDDVFVRCFSYYFTYCEAGFASLTEGCMILTFSRPGNHALLL